MTNKPLCFVLMPFSDELKPVYKKMKSVAEEVGFECKRADEVVVGLINKGIFENIFNAKAIIAELTSSNPNVFYELGVAHAISRKTILITQEGKIPFDIAGELVIKYQNTIEGGEHLGKELKRLLSHIKEGGVIDNPAQMFLPQSPTLKKMEAPPDKLIKSQIFTEAPILISSERKNRLKIDTDFLLWEQCTLMLWVLVSPEGQGLRDSPHNRYILAHNTGKADEKGNIFYNQFAFRHSITRDHWNISISNNKAKYLSKRISIKDALEPGWHHFLITWDRSKSKLLFAIDGGKGGNDLRKNCFSSWPERTAENMFVGAWTSDWAGHYCETKLFNLTIYNRYYDINSVTYKEHLQLKP